MISNNIKQQLIQRLLKESNTFEWKQRVVGFLKSIKGYNFTGPASGLHGIYTSQLYKKGSQFNADDACNIQIKCSTTYGSNFLELISINNYDTSIKNAVIDAIIRNGLGEMLDHQKTTGVDNSTTWYYPKLKDTDNLNTEE